MMRASRVRHLLPGLLCALLFIGCGDDDGPTGPGDDAGSSGDAATPPADCVPSRAQWDEAVRPLVEDACGTCHGTEPDFGAPFSLLDYDALLAGAEGERVVDELVRQVAAGTMPPVGAPLPSLTERDTLTQWGSCGAVRVESPVGVDANRPPFRAPDEPPTGLETIELTAGDYAVGPDVLDRYVDFDFTNLTEEDVFIRRFEAIVDESRVLHHLTLRRGDPAMGDAGMIYLYAWAPGTGAIEFPEGGVRLRPDDTLRLQIHYNNGAGIEDAVDDSGIRLYVTAPEGDEYVMVDPGPGAFGFTIPARSEGTAERTCTVREPVRVLASMPHMHEIGSRFALDLTRDGRRENVLALESWSFETQLFYDLPLELERGDALTVHCEYDNPRDEVVSAGPRTQDEMCYAFTYVTPPTADFCGESAPELDYRPGACIAEPVGAPPEVVGEVTDSGPSFDAGGAFPEGHFVVDRLVLVSDSADLLSLADFTYAGQLVSAGGALEIDGALHIVAPTADLRDGSQTDISFGGTLDAAEGPTTITTSCPAGADYGFRFGTVDGVPAMTQTIDGDGVGFDMWVFYGDDA
ncbi:MAG TPA: hypothetical protein RMH85_33925 [Polyangiaceae bacterium LLY-WYZ-15_(1-7)]|nr:hypothetical protein [Sandaracinus sp.]HJL00820.1 hypothetical protein [Polyangiaceae bacterium LLY-WYZ-15_(1-7)]HJL13532.1 hypothetical protein [Polyangiaceae bacterium LLY-WYZ-15_(1-7)]HJL26586.1 hypothetical protein [Polyangiaceae bacterium LLY-WYZ-15_(1-7)]HJL36129.1 hypothetical protein [Polyangiaceae bacterium LLY-WYZ-15_(1-7)]